MTIQRAFRLAAEAHQGQVYGKLPYIYHCFDVFAELLKNGLDFELDEKILVAAILHDIVEDTSVPLGDIYSDFGPIVGRLVEAVTGEGDVRHSKQENIFQKISQTEDAVLIKLADRVVNVRACAKPFRIPSNIKILEMYRKENRRFLEIMSAAPLALVRTEKVRNHLLAELEKVLREAP